MKRDKIDFFISLHNINVLRFQRSHINHKAVFYIAFEYALVGLVNLLNVDDFHIRLDDVLTTRIEHFLRLSDAADGWACHRFAPPTVMAKYWGFPNPKTLSRNACEGYFEVEDGVINKNQSLFDIKWLNSANNCKSKNQRESWISLNKITQGTF